MADESAVRVTDHAESPVRHRLEVEVDAARVRRAFERAFRDLARQARVRGFRPGKTPRSVLEKLYGPQMREEIERQLVSESLREAMEQAGLSPVTEPTIDAQPPSEDAPFRYTAQIEVKPKLELPNLEGLPGRRPRVEVSDTDVLSELEALRQRQAQLVEEPEDTPAARGHVLRIDFEGRLGDRPFAGGSGKDVAVELGSERFLPGFAEQLEGARAGQERAITVRFPDDYGNPELAGQEAAFSVRVHSVQRRELPELDDEFAKDLGEFQDLDALRRRIRTDLEAARSRQSEAALRGSLLDAVLARTAFDVPAGLIERRLERRLARAHQELEGSVEHDTLHAQLEQWRESWRSRAEREVREALVLEAVAEAQAIAASDEEVDARIREMASAEGVDTKRLLRAYRENEVFEALRAQLRDEKALAFLASKASIDDVSDT